MAGHWGALLIPFGTVQKEDFPLNEIKVEPSVIPSELS